eukprot:53894-Chlamydomonas_euryale.AAC.5
MAVWECRLWACGRVGGSPQPGRMAQSAAARCTSVGRLEWMSLLQGLGCANFRMMIEAYVPARPYAMQGMPCSARHARHAMQAVTRLLQGLCPASHMP